MQLHGKLMGAAVRPLQSKASHMEAHLGCTHQVLKISALHMLAPMLLNQCTMCIWTGRLSLGTGLPLGATWRHQGGAKYLREGCWVGSFADVTSVECHHFIPPLHWACSIAMLTGDEQPVGASRGLWRSTMAGEGKDREHSEGHVLEDLQEKDNRFHNTRSNSFCC